MTTPRFGTSVCWTPIATDSNSNYLSEKSVTNRPQIWHLCVLDPNSNLIITVTTYRKKASLTTPRFGTSVCWTPIATDSKSNHLSEKSVTNHPQIWHLCVLDPYSN